MTDPPKTDSTARNHAVAAAFNTEVHRLVALSCEAFHDLDPRTLVPLVAVITVTSREMPCS